MLKTTSHDITEHIEEIFEQLGAAVSLRQTDGLVVTAPATGEVIAAISRDDSGSVNRKVEHSQKAQIKWETNSRAARAEFLNFLSDAVKRQHESFSALITYEGGKKPMGASAEVSRAWGILAKTVQDATLPDLPNLPHLQRERTGQPAGVVGLITSFNFPLAVASWNLAPALLAGNSVAWKPSEKTPLTALAYKGLFDKTVQEFNAVQNREAVPADLLTVVIGEREIGEALVAHPKISLVSATGSTAMGNGIRNAWANKPNNELPPILELGGNNAVIISNRCDSQTRAFAVNAVLFCIATSGGQFCTDSRRIIVHAEVYDEVLENLLCAFETYIASGAIQNPLLGDIHGDKCAYAPLIDYAAYDNLTNALTQAAKEGGNVHFGRRLHAETYPDAYYVEPALIEMPESAALDPASVIQRETFAPAAYLVKYEGGIENAIGIVNFPQNARLVNALYTQSAAEISTFTQTLKSGDAVINSELGTVGPMRSEMGFGGLDDSGQGIVLNSADPTGPFTRSVVRAVRNTQISLLD